MSTVAYTALRPRMCESSVNRKCRNEIWLTWADYLAASAQGNVVCYHCVPNHAAVVRYLNAGSAAVVA